jgi:hypothetical protein
MPIVIDEVVAQVEPEPISRPPQAAPPKRDEGAEIVRAQLAMLAYRASRLYAD